MALDIISENKLDLINPIFADKFRTLAEMMELIGYPIKLVQGLRSWSEQQKLWLIGRNEDGTVMDEKAIVTKAPPGHSWHEYGMAGDGVPLALINKPGWDPESSIWPIYGAKAESLGLTWGGRWHRPDRPHVQLTGDFPVSPTDEVRHIFREVGMAGVWTEAGLQTRTLRT